VQIAPCAAVFDARGAPRIVMKLAAATGKAQWVRAVLFPAAVSVTGLPGSLASLISGRAMHPRRAPCRRTGANEQSGRRRSRVCTASGVSNLRPSLANSSMTPRHCPFRDALGRKVGGAMLYLAPKRRPGRA